MDASSNLAERAMNICNCGKPGESTLTISSCGPYPRVLEERAICGSCAEDFKKEKEKAEQYWEDLKAGRIDILGRPIEANPECEKCRGTGRYYLVTGDKIISGDRYDIADTYDSLKHFTCECVQHAETNERSTNPA